MEKKELQARALGPKLLLVGALAFLMWIPCLMIYALSWERSTRADTARNEIYALAGGRQVISGPVILVPASVETERLDKTGAPIFWRTTVVFTPKTLSVTANLDTSVRSRSIYDATIYDAGLVMTGAFAPLSPPHLGAGEVHYDWAAARIAVKLADESNLKGISGEPVLTIDGVVRDSAFEPGISYHTGDENGRLQAPGVSAPLPIADPARGIGFRLEMRLSGGGSVEFSPVGETTSVTLDADWPHPSFFGARLPDERRISATDFSASWRIPYLARSLPRSFAADSGLSLLDSGKSFGVKFAASGGPYQSVNRALKYSLLFLGVVFLTFFLIEATMGGRAHPVQYLLLGLAQIVFFLLILSLSEHIRFDTAFISAASATTLLSGFYAATVFRSLLRGLIAFTAFAGAYGLIYLLMKSEDYALLIGSVAAFGGIALTMAATRNIDWYDLGGRRTGSLQTQGKSD
ncbi:MAG: cell envelope integrity protein CreD [Parvularculaceae bacterium]